MAEKHRVFEEVGDQPAFSEPAGGMIEAGRRGAPGAIRLWLMLLFTLVVLMIAVGGLTRLTDSGLSITEWAPVSGSVPPLSPEAWQAEFDAYRASPEYELQNKGMTLDEFKFIFWWEWGHRQLGRIIGLVWAVGYLGFLVTRRIPNGWTGRLLLPGVLGGLQGAIGWWMVASGLDEGMTDVASYRLAVHLGLAFVILGVLAWYTLLLGRGDAALLQARRSREHRLFGMTTALICLAFLQIFLGALVAGIDAGRAFPTWPLMGDGFFPPDPFMIEPLWRNFFEDAGLVQFVHRMTGYLLFAFGIVVWRRARRSPNMHTRFAFNAVLAMLSVQMLLGIAAVLYSAPWHIAVIHQIGAVVLWALILRARFLAGYPRTVSVRE